MTNTHIALRSENPSEIEAIAFGPEEFVREAVAAELKRNPLRPAEEIQLVRVENVWYPEDEEL